MSCKDVEKDFIKSYKTEWLSELRLVFIMM